MELSYLVIPVLAGFWINSRLLSRKAEFLASSNPAIVYESAVLGGVVFASVWITLAVVKTLVCVTVFEANASWISVFDIVTGYGHCIDDNLPFPNADSLSLTVVGALVYPLFANWNVDENAKLLAWIRKSRPLGFLIVDAWEKGYPLMATTSQNAVYVGWVLEAPTISPQREIWDISMFPVFEGYLDENERKVFITENRLVEFEEIIQSLESDDDGFENVQALAYTIVLPTSEITSIRNFEKTSIRNFDFTYSSMNQ